MNLSFVGSGNVAWHLAPALENAGFPVREVYSRQRNNAEKLAARLYEAEVQDHLDFSGSASQVFFLTVSDDAIRDVVREIVLPDNALLLHCSGSQPLQVLEFAATPHTGVLYPFQTFSRGRKIELDKVPFFIEGSDEETLSVVRKLARALSRTVQEADSGKRLHIHLAGVFASNFTNHMLAVARDIMEEQHLSFDVLRPLIAETINKALDLGPALAQTGPARRGDNEVLERHADLLSADEDLAAIYRHVSQSILDRFAAERYDE
jgi:predicted short-subunit dehydrogenase-like oxidoreductase (DUF2520 family)